MSAGCSFGGASRWQVVIIKEESGGVARSDVQVQRRLWVSAAVCRVKSRSLEVWQNRTFALEGGPGPMGVTKGLWAARHICMAYARRHHRLIKSITHHTSAKHFHINAAASSTSTASTHTLHLPLPNTTKTKQSPCYPFYYRHPNSPYLNLLIVHMHHHLPA
jgi:hypothetical protein